MLMALVALVVMMAMVMVAMVVMVPMVPMIVMTMMMWRLLQSVTWVGYDLHDHDHGGRKLRFYWMMVFQMI